MIAVETENALPPVLVTCQTNQKATRTTPRTSGATPRTAYA